MSNTKDTPMDYKQFEGQERSEIEKDMSVIYCEVCKLNNAIHYSNAGYFCCSCFAKHHASITSELQKQKQEIANHIAVNSLLIDSEGEADLANKLYQCQGELQKQKELKAELVNALKVIIKERSFRGGFPHTTNVFESLIKKSNEI